MLLLIRRIACCCWIGVRLINPGSGGEWKEEWSAKRKREKHEGRRLAKEKLSPTASSRDSLRRPDHHTQRSS